MLADAHPRVDNPLSEELLAHAGQVSSQDIRSRFMLAAGH